VQAQDAEMADVMRSNGKIYVVIAVMVTILLGVVIYLIRLDRKISKLEKNK
jgi:CcmD family protein